MTAELVAVELDRLNEFEHTIEVGLQTFEAVGHALGAIRDERLYRESHDTFEAYCTERWGFTDRRARQIIDAAETVAALPTGTMVPVSERQARELVGLEPETAAAVMTEAASNGTPTAASIKEARAHVTETSRTSEATKTEYDVNTETGEIRAVRQALDEHVPADNYALTSWRKHFGKAVGDATNVQAFPIEQVAEKANAELLEELERAYRDLGNYITRVRKATSGLRVIGGRS